MTNDFTVTLKRQGNTVSSSGAKKLSFSTANRTADGAPTSVSASMQFSDSDENMEFGIKESETGWCMYTASDPELFTKDQVEWTDDGGIARVGRVAGPSLGMAGKGRIWKAIIAENKNRT
jgi:hypothetical protein